MVSPTALNTRPFSMARSRQSEPTFCSAANLVPVFLSLHISSAATNPLALASPTIGWSIKDCHRFAK